MVKAIMIIIGLLFMFAGMSRLFSGENPTNSMSLLSMLSGLLFIARGIKYSGSGKEKRACDLTEYKLFASRLYLKGKSDKKVCCALLRKGLPEEQINQVI